MTDALRSLKYERGSLSVLDQLLLPLELQYVEVCDSRAAWTVIRNMQVRGAPLIAIVAALGLAVEANSYLHGDTAFFSINEAKAFLLEALQYLRTSRPTAVNLFQATDALAALVNDLSNAPEASPTSVLVGYMDAAEEMLLEDVATNIAIGNFGAAKILELIGKSHVKVLTICNTGSLATAGYGTALGVVRSLAAMGSLEQVYACETRPYNQGARLTAFEIVQDKLPGTLITDSMASYLMTTKGVDCVVVGADRVAANGDTANKIGTFQLAIAAHYHGIPFFVAAPTTTIDLATPNGGSIHIEERPQSELTSMFGQKIAPDGIVAWNPAFDVTPSHLITGVITQLGVAMRAKDAQTIDIAAFLGSSPSIPTSTVNDSSTPNTAAESLTVTPPLNPNDVTLAYDEIIPKGFHRMDIDDLSEYIYNNATLSSALNLTPLTSDTTSKLSIKEVGDGNINFVYIVSSETKTIVIKQALPYIRCVGESWPLTLERASFEMKALVAHGEICPGLVPKVLHFDAPLALLSMEYIPPPHIILRRALIARTRVNCFRDIAYYMAHTLSATSTLALSGPSFRALVAEWSRNVSMCGLTEQVIFSDPYIHAPLNRHNSPYLDSIVNYIKSDSELIVAAAALKGKFLGSTQALLHGDLHTGSIMVADGSTYVIDPEFAFMGPMGFDLGALLSNLFFSYFSQEPAGGFDQTSESRESEYATWLTEQIAEWHSCFVAEFVSCWDVLSKSSKGVYFSGGVTSSATTLSLSLQKYLGDLWADTLGFAGMKMIRRIVGVSHVADLDEISDPFNRSVCEKKCLLLGRMLVLASQERAGGSLSDIHKVLAVARRVYALSSTAMSDMQDWRLKWKVAS